MSIRQASGLTRILQKVTAPLSPYYSPIVDVSRYQYPIDWDVMWNAGARIVFLRCTVGNYYTDTAFAEFWKGAKARGFLVGVYHVNTPEYSYQSQMGRLFGSLGLDGRRPAFPIVLDCELTRNQSPAAISNNILGCLQTIEDEDGRLPFIYTSKGWWDANTLAYTVWKKYGLFVANYTFWPSPSLPRDWTAWLLWQHSADGNMQGSNYGAGSSSIDLSRANAATLEETIRLMGGALPDPDPDPEETQMRRAKCIQVKINARPQPNKSQDCGDLYLDQTITYFPGKIWKSPDGTQEWWPGVTDHLVNGAPLIAYFAYKHPDFGAGRGLVDVGPIQS